MKFMNPACLIKKAYRKLFHEDHDQTTSKKKKYSTTFDVFVGKEEKRYRVPHEYRTHPKLLELINKYQYFVLDPRSSDPIVLECFPETFELFLRSVVKNNP